jgi:hypothetical protein
LLEVLSDRIDNSRMRRQLSVVSARQQQEMHNLIRIICEESPALSHEQTKLFAL